MPRARWDPPSSNIAETDTLQSSRAEYLQISGYNFLRFPTSRCNSLCYSLHDFLCNCLVPLVAGGCAIYLSNTGCDIANKCTPYKKAVPKLNLLPPVTTTNDPTNPQVLRKKPRTHLKQMRINTPGHLAPPSMKCHLPRVNQYTMIREW